MLICEHRLVVGTPVDLARLAVCEAALVQAREDPLIPAVVLGAVRHQHAVPVKRACVAFHRGALLGDVVLGPPGRVDAALDGGVLSGKPKRVPADGVQHVVATQHPVARDDVAERVRLRVAHVKVTRGVREHVEYVLRGTLIALVA